MLSYCAGVSCSVYFSSLSFFALPSSLALLQRLPGSFQFSRNFDLPSRFCYTPQTKEAVRTAALLNVQTSCNKVCINNASWNTDFFFFLNCGKEFFSLKNFTFILLFSLLLSDLVSKRELPRGTIERLVGSTSERAEFQALSLCLY